MKNNIFKLLALGSMLLVLIFACGGPPGKESENKTSSIEPQQEILKKKVEHEAKKVAKILQKTGEKLQNIPKNNLIEGEKKSKDINFLNNHKQKLDMDKNLNYSEVPDIARFQEEALKSVQEDPLYQALSILEKVKKK
ncbi:hypothetical protein TDIS_2129 [Thermosulfurimonas dismutans]|uniref:Lipoprotein n=2 Tax=Thermosulfurimonas dismutans TaxID=999894 RepID=A0A179D2A3_9BACT|nr:hypothetical protein TDIS_2129 [Thermosulfurimonas dismutans]